MIEKIKDVSASIHAKLINEAKRQNRTFNEILQYYGMDRWLFRLSKTVYAEKFLLKGGLLFYSWGTLLRRPTKDIDFRGLVQNSRTNIENIVKEICLVPAPDDGLIFDTGSVEVVETQVDADYAGMRVTFLGYLGNAKIYMQLDIGFSDPVIPNVIVIGLPSLLPNMPQTKLKGYPPEIVIAEKYHAMVRFGEINSRLKDYYDIWLLTRNFNFQMNLLHQTINETFRNRSTELPTERPQALSHDFSKHNQKVWVTFLRKNKIENDEIKDLCRVVDEIWKLLEVTARKLSPNEIREKYQWVPSKGWIR